MALNKKAMVKLGLVPLVMAFAANVEARVDPNTFLNHTTKDGEPNFFKSTKKPCCNDCTCTKSNSPQCRCTDVGETSHSACKRCQIFDTYHLEYRCEDITTFCYPPCSSATKPN